MTCTNYIPPMGSKVKLLRTTQAGLQRYCYPSTTDASGKANFQVPVVVGSVYLIGAYFEDSINTTGVTFYIPQP